jgi:predicted TIM-barrel fold metal-dependent hydrolase
VSTTVSTPADRLGKQEIPVEIVDTDVHPTPASRDEIAVYAPAEWVDRLFPTNPRQYSGWYHYYDTPDTWINHAKMDAQPPSGGPFGSDPDFATEQLLVDAGVSIGILEPMFAVLRGDEEHALAITYNNWLADQWLGSEHNAHERWRGVISVSFQEPEQGAREIERWAGHPFFAAVQMWPQTRGIPFGSPHFDPVYEAATRHGLPVSNHLAVQCNFDQTPLYPFGNPGHYTDFYGCWPLLLAAHLSSLVFDGAFERHPELKIVFVEGGFTWAMPMLWRMDKIWELRKADLPHVRRKPSDYVRDHVFWATQPVEEVEVSEFRRYLELRDLGGNIMTSTAYPHWSYDSPAWAATRFPAAQRERIMHANAQRVYGLPATVPAIAAAV